MQPQQPPMPMPVPMPPPHRHTRLIVAIVVVVVAVVVVGAYLWLVWYPTTLQPRISLTDALYSTSGCGLFGPYYLVYTLSFNLTNTGGANGVATVSFYVNGNGAGAVDYLVPAVTTVQKAVSIQGAMQSGFPCTAEAPTLAITHIYKV